MEFTFENQRNRTYLVYSIKEDDVIDTMTMGMLSNNKISGLADTIFTQMDQNRYVKYDVSAKVSVNQFFSGPVNKKRLLGVFQGIIDAFISADDYMIDPGMILLDLDYMFTDVSSCETTLICLPILRDIQNPDFVKFFKQIMFSTQFDQTENCDHVASIINYLNNAAGFSLEGFKQVLIDIDNQNSKPVVKKVEHIESHTNIGFNSQPRAETITQPQIVQGKTPEPTGAVTNNPVSQNQDKVQTPSPINVHEAASDTHAKEEKEISFMYLMQHYNKENAALYKAQKEAKKQTGQLEKAKSNKPDKKEKKKQNNMKPDFAVPGQQQDFGFAIPGQPAPASAPIQPAQPVQKPIAPPVSQPVSAPSPTPQPVNIPRPIQQGRPMNFGETTVLNAGTFGETTVLMANQTMNQVPTTPYLIRNKTNEKIQLNKPVFRIGKERSYVDYFVSDNTAVSRSHANFITRDGQYFVVDTNSTNHTFLNGAMLQSNQEYPIKPGDVIRLGNEDFEFKLF